MSTSSFADGSMALDHLSSESLTDQCLDLAREKYGIEVVVNVTRRHSFTMAEVLPESGQRRKLLPSVRPMTAIGASPRASLELLWRKLHGR